ncbi:hypothetical protein [Aestuariivirga sp.]|uniref:hypothetical protein n=1 Tax=Aestuariivirga sp. TaxID=2650926 RepID=UPI0039E4E1B9
MSKMEAINRILRGLNAKGIPASHADIPGLFNVHGYPELTVNQLLGLFGAEFPASPSSPS